MLFDLRPLDVLALTPYSRGCFNGMHFRKGLNKYKSRKLNKLARKARRKLRCSI